MRLQAMKHVCLAAHVTASISASHNESADLSHATQRIYALLHICEQHWKLTRISALASKGLCQGA